MSRLLKFRAFDLLLVAGLCLVGWVAGVLSSESAEMATPLSPAVQVDQPSSDFSAYTLKAGTPLNVLLQSRVTTANNQAGNVIEAALAQNLYLGDRLILSRDSRLLGRIIRLEPPIQGRNAILEIRFTDILLPNGEKLELQSHIKTPLADHSWGGEVTPGTKPKRVIHHVWGIGDYNKIVMSGPRAMGEHIEFLPGERWTVILEAPLTLMVRSEY